MMKKSAKSAAKLTPDFKSLLICIVLATGLIYFFSNPNPQAYFDYTFRVAENFLYGQIGFIEKPPSWLNEFVPFEGKYYSVFPLGSVISMIPFAFLKFIGLVSDMPSSLIAGLQAAGICCFLLLIAKQYDYGWGKRILFSTGILFGTWMWTNLTMAGAWQLALGFAVLGELGAIYFTVFNRRPVLAGAFFALAFGNRTEILLTAPVFMFLLLKDDFFRKEGATDSLDKANNTGLKKDEKNTGRPNSGKKTWWGNFSAVLFGQWKTPAKFCIIPFILGISTLIYNYLRFHSYSDFGYARIPGVLNEPWYRYGIFSIYYIPLNFREMLFTPWKLIKGFPYIIPNGFGGAIWWSSPFLIFLLRFASRDKILKITAWAAIFVLLFLLWIHGNPGGWQFGYRYAMILLPWMFLILLENSPRKITVFEWLAFIFSFIINAYATYLFFWTDYVRP